MPLHPATRGATSRNLRLLIGLCPPWCPIVMPQARPRGKPTPRSWRGGMHVAATSTRPSPAGGAGVCRRWQPARQRSRSQALIPRRSAPLGSRPSARSPSRSTRQASRFICKVTPGSVRDAIATSRGSIAGLAGMRSRRWALRWHQFGPLVGSRQTPTEQGALDP